MKKVLVVIYLFVIGLNAQAGCLDDISASLVIKSKIRGFLINKAAKPDHYVIVDKLTCISEGNSVTLANYTKNNYYLRFDAQDIFLLEFLSTAYAKGDIVEFRIGSEIDGANIIEYIVLPSDAAAQ